MMKKIIKNAMTLEPRLCYNLTLFWLCCETTAFCAADQLSYRITHSGVRLD